MSVTGQPDVVAMLQFAKPLTGRQIAELTQRLVASSDEFLGRNPYTYAEVRCDFDRSIFVPGRSGPYLDQQLAVVKDLEHTSLCDDFLYSTVCVVNWTWTMHVMAYEYSVGNARMAAASFAEALRKAGNKNIRTKAFPEPVLS